MLIHQIYFHLYQSYSSAYCMTRKKIKLLRLAGRFVRACFTQVAYFATLEQSQQYFIDIKRAQDILRSEKHKIIASLSAFLSLLNYYCRNHNKNIITLRFVGDRHFKVNIHFVRLYLWTDSVITTFRKTESQNDDSTEGHSALNWSHVLHYYLPGNAWNISARN